MRKLLLFFVFSNCWAGPYFEAGSFYTNDKLWYYSENGERLEESGLIGHVATGYEFDFDKFTIDIQFKHQSDPKNRNEADITKKDSAGVLMRYKLW